ncbi:hypothetical protein [Psychromicrobium sp. YIM B11713]
MKIAVAALHPQRCHRFHVRHEVSDPGTPVTSSSGALLAVPGN